MVNYMEKNKEIKVSFKKWIFFPPWLLLVALVVISLWNEEKFLDGMHFVTNFILENFAWAFNTVTLLCLGTVIFVFFSPLGKVRIGGRKARPIMSFSNLVWITLCTTVASGILFWGCAEPLYHFYQPAISQGVEPGSAGAAIFAMKTMFLEWTLSPYAIYTVVAVLFAFVFYNMKQSYSIGSAFVPVFGGKVKKYGGIIDVVCLVALVLGMAASLGTGTLTLGGGIEKVFGITSGPASWAVIIFAIVAVFIISSVSGIMKGIRILSSVNGYVYVFLLVFILIFGPTAFMLNFSVESLGAYLQDFFRMSLETGEITGDSWARSWPIFYWCVWMAWAPISGVFLGKILKGYTVRDAIKCNFFIPAVFSMIWMGLFSSSSIYYEMQGKGLYDSLLNRGTESVVYEVLEQLPISSIIIPFYLFIVFISFVTAADSNTNAMAGLCVDGITVDNQESPAWLKICWGMTLGILTWVVISFAGVDGIKAASDLGGFPSLFIMIILAIGLIKVSRNPVKYDVYKEDYDIAGHPIESVRLSIERDEEK